MPTRASKIASSLKQIGDIHVNDVDLRGLLNTDIEELEISRSLRRLGRIRVTDWEFSDVLPAVKKVANQEVHVMDFLRRTANYKVMDWDFRVSGTEGSRKPEEEITDSPEIRALIVRLKGFLQYLVLHLVEKPELARIRVSPLQPRGLRFRLVLVKKDVSTLIGREGQTAAAIRGMMKAAARSHGVDILLQIHSHEEEADDR
ncbi:KH domain-containing protein [Luteolibacter yonseiensis]|uniref:KH domain-containing protein n=1 Tax=Luteolibacter yonseiensis TaxID=1144680 RepID=A0A934VE18_9BACT|nr:KH domain-containing protein [Luteolibacter yonseiensis]MBK1818154.1 KH domain-containing protein [Luteolibacter yonseiensis]